MDPHPIRVVALCSTILGVFFLTKSITVKSPKYMLHDLLRFKVNKSRFFRNYLAQRLEAFIGFMFLFVGAGLQIYLEVHALAAQEAAEGGRHTSFTNWYAVMGATLGAMLALALLLNRITRFFSGRIFADLVRFMVENHGYPLESDESLVLELGKIMRVRREEDDTVESYGRRVRTKLKLPGDGRPPAGERRPAY